MTPGGRIDEIQALVDAGEGRGQIRIHLPQRVDGGPLLQHDHREPSAVEAAQLSFHLVDADLRATDDRHPSVGDRDTDELIDLLEVVELLRGIDEAIDGALSIGGVLEQVEVLPASPALGGELRRAQPLDPRLGLGQDLRGKTTEILLLEPERIDYALEAQERHDPRPRRSAAVVQADVIQEDPDREDRVQVGVVGIDGPVALAEIEPGPDQDHRLLTGGQRERTDAPFVVVEVIDLALRVEERRASRRAIEEDGARGGTAGGSGRHAEPVLDSHSHGRRLDTRQDGATDALLDAIAAELHGDGGLAARGGSACR